MRYPQKHKAQSREKLVRASASLAKREGFAASGVDALAGAAGLTSGAFYKHFQGKADLLATLLETELAATRERFASITPGDDAQLLEKIDAYLSLWHVRHPESGCVLPTLAAEIARAPLETCAVYERALADLQSLLAEKIGDSALTSALLAQCVGAVMLARGLASDEARRAMLQAARAGARLLLAPLREKTKSDASREYSSD